MWEYPNWEVSKLGGGMVVAAIATAHVLVAHFSVGGGFLLAIGETRARRMGDETLLSFLRYFSKYLILIGFVFGAVSGVAIWFSISIVATRATSTLIHNFVWFWAIEWVFFLVEIVAGYAYYVSWKTLPAKRHLQLAWIYAFCAWMSLVVISGILSFMLSPGRWIETRNIWDGFFNPTFWPTVGLRTISSLSLAALGGMIFVHYGDHYTREERTRVINFLAWFLSPLVLMLPFAGWYFLRMPPLSQNLLGGGAAPMMLFFLFGIAASTLVGLYAYFGLIRRKRFINLETGLLLFAIAVIATVTMEFVREGIRKPYLIYNHTYSNGLEKDEVEAVNQRGVLASAPWFQKAVEAGRIDPGEALYRIQCSGCHVIEGFNDVIPLIRSWDRDLLEYNLQRLHELKPFMPPVVGTQEERTLLLEYLLELKREESTHSMKAQAPADDRLDPLS
jgi:mono/diheme cytochrome c family protein